MTFLDAPRRSTARRWLFQIHLWVGLVLGPLIGVVGLTGSVVVFRYELNRVTTPGTASVEPQGERLTLDELAAIVQAARPEDTPRNVGWGEVGPRNAWNFRAESPEGHRIHTFINQYTGEITGRDDYHDKWLQWFYDLHAELLGGDTGMFLNGFVGVAAALLSVTGLVVWWPGAALWRFGFLYKRGTSWKRHIGLNYVYLEPADARLIRGTRFSEASLATRAILFMYPLHFGRFGGRWGPVPFYGVMVCFVLLGVAQFALMATGLLMYWNRSFSKKWRAWRSSGAL